ncbi:MAG: hypothetical protein JWR50_1890 [Mucilaginibacter sp.]|nr:hypothetical protein [Mucilaginibacter sp.]
MHDKNQLTAVLKGDGSYKIIGKPVLAAVGDKDKNADTKDKNEQ